MSEVVEYEKDNNYSEVSGVFFILPNNPDWKTYIEKEGVKITNYEKLTVYYIPSLDKFVRSISDDRDEHIFTQVENDLGLIKSYREKMKKIDEYEKRPTYAELSDLKNPYPQFHGGYIERLKLFTYNNKDFVLNKELATYLPETYKHVPFPNNQEEYEKRS